ncbi:hypothetical protein OAK65_02650 [Synechococcus sp. AH-551-N17]|nr:hypothetical protein [Synechococcus sp. AH-551-N17]
MNFLDRTDKITSNIDTKILEVLNALNTSARNTLAGKTKHIYCFANKKRGQVQVLWLLDEKLDSNVKFQLEGLIEEAWLSVHGGNVNVFVSDSFVFPKPECQEN